MTNSTTQRRRLTSNRVNLLSTVLIGAPVLTLAYSIVPIWGAADPLWALPAAIPALALGVFAVVWSHQERSVLPTRS